ncbi:hypothetical protein PG995_004063 [Apiospora arundinis]
MPTAVFGAPQARSASASAPVFNSLSVSNPSAPTSSTSLSVNNNGSGNGNNTRALATGLGVGIPLGLGLIGSFMFLGLQLRKWTAAATARSQPRVTAADDKGKRKGAEPGGDYIMTRQELQHLPQQEPPSELNNEPQVEMG